MSAAPAGWARPTIRGAWSTRKAACLGSTVCGWPTHPSSRRSRARTPTCRPSQRPSGCRTSSAALRASRRDAASGPAPRSLRRERMRAYRLMGAGRAEVVDLPRPEPGPGEALLRVLAAGVCRTDLALLRSGGDGLALPVTLGHEIVGEVVSGRDRGAVAAVYELLGCGHCAACDRGQDNVCRALVPGALGITRDGGMADYVVAPARNLVILGDVDPVHAAPLTDAGMTALHAVERARPLLEPGATTVIIGIGGLGHLAVQFLRATSKVRVLAVDVDRARLDFAAEIGADDGVLTGPDAGEAVRAANAGRKVDVVYDFVGAQESLDLAA